MVSIMYLSGHVDTSPIALLVYVSEGPALEKAAPSSMQYRSRMQLEHTRPTRPRRLVHRRPVNHPHLRSQADLPRSILPLPSPLPPLNESTGQISQDGGPQTFQYAVHHPQWHTRREILTSFTTEMAMDPAILRLASTTNPPPRRHP